MEISEKAYGPEHQTVALYAGMLGWQLKSTGKLADSGPILERTLRINTKLHGDGHRETVKALVQLGEQYGLEGRVDEAEELFRKAGEARSADIKEFPVYFATTASGTSIKNASPSMSRGHRAHRRSAR